MALRGEFQLRSTPVRKGLLDFNKGLDPQWEDDLKQIQAVVQGYAQGAYGDDQIEEWLQSNPKAATIAIPGIQATRNQREVGQYFSPGGTEIREQSGPTRPGETLDPYAVETQPRADFMSALTKAMSDPRYGGVETGQKIAGIAGQLSTAQGKWADNFEGPVLFDTEGKTYRSTKDGKIVPVSVEGGATIAPPIYPYTSIDPATGQPIQSVISRPQAAKMAGSGQANLGPSASLKPVPSAVQDNLMQGLQAIKALDQMEAGLSETGRLKGVLSKGQVFVGENPKAISFETARNNFRLSAQAMIKGIPSNFDVQTVIDTIPAMTLPESVNTERAKFARSVFNDLIKQSVAFYKGKGFDIPGEIIDQARLLKIDIGSVSPFTGLDPFEKVQKRVEAFKTRESKKGIKPTEVGGAPPAGITQQEWDAMPPEDKKLWK